MSKQKKIGTGHENKYKNVLGSFAGWVNSARMHLFIIMMFMCIIAVVASVNGVKYSNRAVIIENQTADVQNEAVFISAQFANYYSLLDAEVDGMYERLNSYSALNSIRIRVVNSNFLVDTDTYAVDTGKTIVNSKLINMFENPKSSSEYNKKTGNIEAIAPIYNYSNELIAILVVDLDYATANVLTNGADDRNYSIEFIIMTLLISICIIVSCIFFKPFDRAFKVVEDVALGHTDKRIELRSVTEIRNLAANFNDIMDKTNEMDESRAEFVSNVSHELKTPITSIKVLADSLNTQEDVPVEVYREFMQDIAGEIDRENKIIEDLLFMVKLEKSASALNLSSVNINELLEIVLKRLKPLAQKKNIEILFESFRPVVAEVDEVKITQVISNLVENAIKYNNMDGWVHVSLNADHQFFYVRVEDSGIGIPKDCHTKIFERFYRVDKARSRETGGTGLGLSIVKNIILMHHGSIKLYSEEGNGTTFTFRIPLNYVAEL